MPYSPQRPASGFRAAYDPCRRHPWRLFLRRGLRFKSLNISLTVKRKKIKSDLSLNNKYLREKGLEPLCLRHQNLNLACLPIPPLSPNSVFYYISHECNIPPSDRSAYGLLKQASFYSSCWVCPALERLGFIHLRSLTER